MKIIIDCTIEAISSRVDGTINVKIGTQELDSTNAGNLFALRGKYCKVLISDSNISELEAELVDAQALVAGKKMKTPSQRLRAVLYRLREQENEGDVTDFDNWYGLEMNKIIDHYKSKLT